MTSLPHLRSAPGQIDEAARLAHTLDGARRGYWEDPVGALATAVACHEQARALGHAPLRCRALVVQGAVTLHRGDLRGAFALAAEAERDAVDDIAAAAELAALKAHLNFFSGSYAASLQQAERGVELADRTGDAPLRIFARRMGCIAFGNMGVSDWPQRLEELLELTIAAGERWEEALSRNDLAHLRMEEGDLDAAEEQIGRGIAIAEELAPGNRFVLGVLHCTRAEMRQRGGRPQDGLADADRAIGHLTASGEPNPYLLGMTVLVKVQALMTLGRVEDARTSGEAALARLGDRVPQARSMILGAVAGALRDAGRPEEAYDALARCAELERDAMREFSELQLGLERARLEVAAARRVVTELADAHQELERRTRQLEELQDHLRDEVDRDWLTGLHNRRFLARARDADAHRIPGPVSLAVVDLDHFKSVNDRFGHHTGDRVLVRVAALLVENLRGEDMVIRTGGEEFVVLMPNTGEAAAAACCERLRTAFHDAPWQEIAPGLRLTASIGVVSAPDASDIDGLARHADRRLYQAKRAGRDTVAARDDQPACDFTEATKPRTSAAGSE